jgi:hemerythrin-like domain-containing protein
MCAEVVRPPRVVRPARPAVPPLPTLDALDGTHAQMMGTLSQLGGLMHHLREHGVDDTARRNAADICAFFADTARQHHADEERVVFPALMAGGDAELRAHVERLQQDHGWLEEDWIELAPQLQAVSQGYSWYDIDELSHAVSVFTALYRDHIALEESMIYPAARQREAVAAAAARSRQQG